MSSGFSNAAQQWNASLGLSITTSNTNTSAPIRFFGGTNVIQYNEKMHLAQVY